MPSSPDSQPDVREPRFDPNAVVVDVLKAEITTDALRGFLLGVEKVNHPDSDPAFFGWQTTFAELSTTRLADVKRKRPVKVIAAPEVLDFMNRNGLSLIDSKGDPWPSRPTKSPTYPFDRSELRSTLSRMADELTACCEAIDVPASVRMAATTALAQVNRVGRAWDAHEQRVAANTPVADEQSAAKLLYYSLPYSYAVDLNRRLTKALDARNLEHSAEPTVGDLKKLTYKDIVSMSYGPKWIEVLGSAMAEFGIQVLRVSDGTMWPSLTEQATEKQDIGPDNGSGMPGQMLV